MLEIGDVVESIKGHDKGRVYIIFDISGEFAYLVDGEYRKRDKPKKKRLKHLKNKFIKYNSNKELKSLYDYEISTFLRQL